MFEREPLVGTMSAQVARILGTRIVGGEFKPGESLPVEAELCATFGVSRTTIREAIKHLAGKRLIDVSPKIGTRVLPFNEWNLLDRDVLAWRLQGQFDSRIVEDIFEMRLCIEPRASYLAALRGSKEDMQRLDRCYGELADVSSGEVLLAAQADLEFHLTIIAMSKNGLFITIGGAVKAALRVSSEMLHRNASNPGEDLALYQAVRHAIVAREPGNASDAMTQLLLASRRRLLPLTIREERALDI
jgi:DNA-binding FadR family transcriptional regulator